MVDKGVELVNYLLVQNNLSKYEGFLDVWQTTLSADANDLRVTIHNALKNQGVSVPMGADEHRWVPRLPSVTSSTAAASNCQAPTSALQSKAGNMIDCILQCVIFRVKFSSSSLIDWSHK